MLKISLLLLPRRRPVVRAHRQGHIASCDRCILLDGLRPQLIFPCAGFRLLIQHICSQRRYASSHPSSRHHIGSGPFGLCIPFLYWCRINCNLRIIFGFCRTKFLEAS